MSPSLRCPFLLASLRRGPEPSPPAAGGLTSPGRFIRPCGRLPAGSERALRPRVCLQGVRSYSTPVGLESRLLVDLVVVGSVAVSEKGKTESRASGCDRFPAARCPPALRRRSHVDGG